MECSLDCDAILSRLKICTYREGIDDKGNYACKQLTRIAGYQSNEALIYIHILEKKEKALNSILVFHAHLAVTSSDKLVTIPLLRSIVTKALILAHLIELVVTFVCDQFSFLDFSNW